MEAKFDHGGVMRTERETLVESVQIPELPLISAQPANFDQLKTGITLDSFFASNQSQEILRSLGVMWQSRIDFVCYGIGVNAIWYR